MSYALDASAIIAHLDAGDAHHDAASDRLDEAAGERLLAHPLTLAECLVAPVRAGRGAEMVAAIAAMRIEPVEVDGDSPLRLAELRVTTGLRMPDCCVLDVARRHDAAVITFDTRMARAAGRLGLTCAEV